MKNVFSLATLAAVLATLASAAPTQFDKRLSGGPLVATVGAEFFTVVDQANPNTPAVGSQTAVIQRKNGNNEKDTLVSFDLTGVARTAGSTCNLIIRNPTTVTGSGHTQLFTLGGPLSTNTPLTFYQHPFYDQYAGEYNVNLNGDSNAIDVFSIPCRFDAKSQYVFRPQNDNDYITFTQGANTGAFIEVRN